MHKGALVLASTETRFELGENKTPTKINILIVFVVVLFPSLPPPQNNVSLFGLNRYPIAKKDLPIHALVAEFMILANQYVAEKIYSMYPTSALLRHHPFPRKKSFEPLIRCAAVFPTN